MVKIAPQYAAAACLIFSSILKLCAIIGFAFAFGNIAPPISASSFEAESLLICLQVCLALVLICSPRWRPGVVAAAVLFTAFCVWNAISLGRGAATCNCFGDLNVSTYFVFVVDFSLALLLCVVLVTNRHWDHMRSRRLAWICGTGIISTTLIAGSIYAFEGMGWMPYFGRPPVVLAFERPDPTDGHVAMLHVFNRTAQPIRIVGSTPSCGFSLRNLPRLIGPKSHSVIAGTIHSASDTSFCTRLFTDYPHWHRITSTVRFQIIAKERVALAPVASTLEEGK